MRLSTIHLILLGLASTFFACTPRTVLRLDADAAEVKWNYGRQIVQLHQDSMDAEVYFDTYSKNDLIFDVELTNWGSESVLVAPESIYLKCADGVGNRMAADPEWVLLKEEIDASRREANAKNMAIFVGVAAVATVVAVAASDRDNNNNNDDNNSNNYNSNNVYISTYVAPPLPAPVMPPSIDFWANYALRKTTLDENHKVGGKVVVPRMDGCPVLELYLPFGAEPAMVARFKQQVIQP
jgi:hypothetical protein